MNNLNEENKLIIGEKGFLWNNSDQLRVSFTNATGFVVNFYECDLKNIRTQAAKT